jgi:hypothetical protein
MLLALANEPCKEVVERAGTVPFINGTDISLGHCLSKDKFQPSMHLMLVYQALFKSSLCYYLPRQ